MWDFGYGPGTLGLPEPVQLIGGGYPTPGRFSTTQMLVPLPFFYGEPFNIDLQMATTARVVRNTATGQFINTFDISDLGDTLTVTAIAVTDAAGTSVPFDITTASGLQYTSTGIGTPEPATFLTSLAGFAALGVLASILRRRIQVTGSFGTPPK